MPHRWKPNVTVAAVIERDGRFLLVEEQTADGLRLNNPAGHLDPGESLVQACVRETLEETAYEFQPTGLVGIYLRADRTAGQSRRHRRRPRAPPTCGLPFAANWAHLHEPGARWTRASCARCGWAIDEIRASRQRHRSSLLLQCVEDYLAGARYPLSLLATDGVPGIERG